MTDRKVLKFEAAMQAFALANTPLFVVRKLRSDPEVLALSARSSPEHLLDKLNTSLSRKPRSLRSAVMPYVYLVALFLKHDPRHLDLARRLDGSHHDWYNYIANALFQMTPVTNVSTHEAVSLSPSIATANEGLLSYQYAVLQIPS